MALQQRGGRALRPQRAHVSTDFLSVLVRGQRTEADPAASFKAFKSIVSHERSERLRYTLGVWVFVCIKSIHGLF